MAMDLKLELEDLLDPLLIVLPMHLVQVLGLHHHREFLELSQKCHFYHDPCTFSILAIDAKLYFTIILTNIYFGLKSPNDFAKWVMRVTYGMDTCDCSMVFF